VSPIYEIKGGARLIRAPERDVVVRATGDTKFGNHTRIKRRRDTQL